MTRIVKTTEDEDKEDGDEEVIFYPLFFFTFLN
jgi:hypothetical protein